MGDRIRSAKRRRIRAKRQKRRQILLGLILVCIVVVAGIVYGSLYHSVSKAPKNKISDNIYIGRVNVSGMTEKEAVAEIKEYQQADREKNITWKVDEETAETTLEGMGLTYPNIEKAAKTAMNYGKKGSIWNRYWSLRKLKKEKYVVSEKLQLNEKEAKTYLNENAVPLTNHAKDASIKISGSKIKITEEKEGKTVDLAATIEKLETYLNEKWNHEDDIAMKVVQKKEEPSVTSEDLSTVKDELSTFSTDAGGGERWQNLKTGVDHLNGTILMPGEELSVHDKTAPYDAEHGYVEAGSYENGQVVDSFGGGICQVSTTLYNAVLYAELEVVERYPHSMLVDYVEPSRDAAIAGDYLDFVFKNNQKTPIYIAAEIDDNNQMRFTIYGQETRDEGRKVEYESETLTTTDYGIVYRENADAALGSMQYVGSPHTGKTAQLWKVVYQDGEEVSRDVINHSTYEKSDEIIEVGTKSDNPEASAAVRNAIASQDASTIAAAIY